ncbi:MAG TPA: SGNH/GDSL hydrolase family protein [Nitrososphaeraceae archaeon]|nr:SGNH/GDSL hydrolase family protein [Nitrososphaeraceae archaeon]
MVIKEKIKSLVWYDLIAKLKDILNYFNTSTEDLLERVEELENNPVGGVPEAPEDGNLYGRQDGDWTEITGSGEIPITGTERQVAGFDTDGNVQAVTLGWKQFSDLPSPPTFSNGVLTGTAFQPDGSALHEYVELAIDSPDSIAVPNAIPIYQAGTIGTGGGTLPVQDPVEDLDAINKRYFEENKGIEVDTAFVTKPYSATMSVVHNPEQPNFNIILTGNLDLTITGTVNGDSGIINLYFSGTEVATLNGFEDLVITGNGTMIPVYFIHDLDGVKWYYGDNKNNLQPETTDFYKKTIVSGGTIKQSDLIAIDDFITSGKKNGWWEAQKDMCLYLKTNGGINSALVKLKNTTNTNIVNYNYTDSDVKDFGLFAGESLNNSKYLDLGVTMSDLGVDLQNLSTSIFTPLEGSRDYRFNIGDSNNKLGAALSLFVDSNTVTPFILACNNSDEVGAYSETNQPLGVNVITCRNDGLTSFNNGVNYVDTKDIGSGVINGTFEASRRSYGDGNIFYSNIPLSFYSIGTSLTNKQATDMSKDIYNLMLGLGRISTTNSLLSFGDSILKGFSENILTRTYANQVARKMSLNNLNMSRGERISSASSGDVLPALSVYDNLLDFSPKTSTVLFALGTNDILSLDSNSNDFGDPTNLTNFRNYCGAMLAKSLEKGQNLIIVSIAEITTNLTNASLNKQLDYVKVSAELAKENYNTLDAIKVNFVNLFHLFLDSDVDYLLPDGVHFNQEGNLAASKEVIRVISTGTQRRNALLSFGNIAAGASVDINVTVLNAEVGMSTTVTPPSNLTVGLIPTAFVSSDDTVVVRLTNVTGSSIEVTDGKFIIEVKTSY